jgi:hypothetical protein
MSSPSQEYCEGIIKPSLNAVLVNFIPFSPFPFSEKPILKNKKISVRDQESIKTFFELLIFHTPFPGIKF